VKRKPIREREIPPAVGMTTDRRNDIPLSF
jgi:hypothetical protein